MFVVGTGITFFSTRPPLNVDHYHPLPLGRARSAGGLGLGNPKPSRAKPILCVPTGSEIA
jgi:hypothetical protein